MDIIKFILPACHTGLDTEGGADQLSGTATREPGLPQLTEMLVPTPYQALEKKAKKKKGKESKGGPRHKGISDTVSGETEALSSHEGDKEEEEVESDSPCKGRKKERTTSKDPEGEVPKRGKVTLSDSLDLESELAPKRPPRVKPLAES